MSATIRRIDMCLRASSSLPPHLSGKIFRVVGAAAAALAASTWLAGCATDRLEPAPPQGVDLTGNWQLDPNLSDDPGKPPPSESPSEMRHRSGRGRGSVGLPPFGNPAGAGGPTGGTEPDGTENFTSDTSAQSPYVRTLWQNPSSSGTPGSSSRPRGGRYGRLLEVPVLMTIQQKGNRLTIQSKSSSGDVHTDELVSGHSTDIPVGQSTADRDVGWRGTILVVDTKVKSGPTKEDDYALDDEGHLIVSTFVSGGHVPKSQIKRVYDRVSSTASP